MVNILNTTKVGNPMVSDPKIARRILKFMLPILLTQFLQLMYEATDAAVLGLFVGKLALAAVGANNSTINIIIMLSVHMSMGAGIIISRYFGAHDTENLQKAVHTAITLLFFLGLVLTVAGLFLAEPILRLINTPADVIDLSVTYLKIYFCGTVFSMLYNIGASILRATGDSVRPLLYLATAVILNVVLDLITVAGLNMGVAGDAYATILAQFVSMVLVIGRLMTVRGPFRLELKRLGLNFKILKRILWVGLPMALQASLYTFANTILLSRINSFGSDALASWVAAQKIDAFVYCIISSFSLAVTSFVGQNVGAGNSARVMKGAKISILLSAGICLGIGSICAIFARGFVHIFSGEEIVLELGSKVVRVIALTYFIFAVPDCLTAVMRASGDVIMPFALNLFSTLGIRLIYIAVVSVNYHVYMAYVVMYPVSWAILLISVGIYFLTGRWKKYWKRAPDTAADVLLAGL